MLIILESMYKIYFTRGITLPEDPITVVKIFNLNNSLESPENGKCRSWGSFSRYITFTVEPVPSPNKASQGWILQTGAIGIHGLSSGLEEAWSASCYLSL